MKIHCLASSSSGNCYVIQNDDTVILLEAGLDFNTTKSRLANLGIKLNDINVILVTHKHGDHCNKVTLKNLGIYAPICSNRDVLDALSVKNKWFLKEWTPIRIKHFVITPFNVNHDVPALGFMIEDKKSNEKILFINDTEYVRYNFSKHTFSRIMIECNHILKLVDMNDVRARRQIKSHLSLSACKKALKTMNLGRTNEIYLMHLSDSHSNMEDMMIEIAAATGVPTYICLKDGGFI